MEGKNFRFIRKQEIYEPGCDTIIKRYTARSFILKEFGYGDRKG